MAQDDVIVTASRRSRGRPRRLLTGIALLLACLTIVLTTVAIWTHQVALNTNRFSALIENVVTDPAVTDPISRRISIQVVDAIGVQARLDARLPDALKPLAGPLTAAVRSGIEQRLQVAFQDPRIQTALVESLSFSHERIVRLLRGESDVVAVVDGYVTLDVFPLVGVALTELQSIGLIPAEVQLPDLAAPDAPDVLAQRVETALGVTLPPDFGTIQLMPADRLVAAQTVVRIFDLVVVLLVILSVILVTLTVWLARDRRQMLIYLGIGTIVAFLFARMAIRTAEDVIVSGIADGDIAGATRAMLGVTLEDLRGWPAALARQYLTRNLQFDIGPREIEAIRRFHQLAEAALRRGTSAVAVVATEHALEEALRTGLPTVWRAHRAVAEAYRLAGDEKHATEHAAEAERAFAQVVAGIHDRAIREALVSASNGGPSSGGVER